MVLRQSRWWRWNAHIIDGLQTLVHITTSGQLHLHPVGHDMAGLNELNNSVDFYLAGFEHFRKYEALFLVGKRMVHPKYKRVRAGASLMPGRKQW